MAKETIFDHPPRGHVAILGYENASDKFIVAALDADGRLEIVLPYEEALGARMYGYDGSSWQKAGLPLWYNAAWDEQLGGTATATTWDKYSGTVPAGELWILQAVSIANGSGVGGLTFIRIYRASGAIVYLNYAASVVQYQAVLATGNFTLAAGDNVRVYMTGIVIGNSIAAGLVGYKMKLAM